jgi:hypothetical protein
MQMLWIRHGRQMHHTNQDAHAKYGQDCQYCKDGFFHNTITSALVLKFQLLKIKGDIFEPIGLKVFLL